MASEKTNDSAAAPDAHIDIDYVANLARLQLTDEEKQRFSSQLEHILGHFDAIRDIDVSAIEPMAHAMPVYNVLQQDTPEPGLTADEALRHAPAQRDNQVVVPKVVENA